MWFITLQTEKGRTKWSSFDRGEVQILEATKRLCRINKMTMIQFVAIRVQEQYPCEIIGSYRTFRAACPALNTYRDAVANIPKTTKGVTLRMEIARRIFKMHGCQ